MKETKDCKIVQDLLPNYIEKLTTKETNCYIEEHLKQCSQCRNIFTSMEKDLKINNPKRDTREVKYFKRYKKKLMILKITLLIILVVIVINTGRKISIISYLSKKAETYVDSTNYHRIAYYYDQGDYTKLEVFSLGDKKKIVKVKETDKGRNVVKMFATEIENDKYQANIYTETEDKKTVNVNTSIGISVNPQNMMYTENWWQLFIYSIPASITTKRYNGSECYYIANFQSPYMYCSQGMYISKQTGLPISTIAYEIQYSDGTQGRWPAAEYIYEFDVVTIDDFIEPDISKYEIEQ